MFDDTTSDARAVHDRVLRSIGMAGRMAMTFELSDNMRSIVADGVRYRHPEWDEQAVEREVLRLMIGDDLFREAFGKDRERPMTTQKDFLHKLITLLEEVGIPYMIAGSLGSSFYGQPRATQDVDVVIDPSGDQLERLIALLDQRDCYVSRDAARDALRRRAMFNVIDTEAGWKADLIVRKDRAFSMQEFQRRRRIEMMGQTLWIASSEDVILSKLEWAQGRQSEVQHADALAVAVAHFGQLNLEYLDRWAKELGIEDELVRLLTEAKLRAEETD